MLRPALLASLLCLSCGGVMIRDDGGLVFIEDDAGEEANDAGVDDGGMLDAGQATDAGSTADAGADAGSICPPGQICVDSFPYTNTNDTSLSTRSTFDRYDCAANTN